LFAGPHPILIANTPILWSGPCGPGVGVSPHKLNFTWQTHPEEQFLFAGPRPILIANTPIWWSGPCGPGVGVSPPQIKFYMANPPRGAIFICWPPPYSHCKYLHLVEWTLRARGWGEPPTNKILQCKPTPRSNFCLLASAQSLTLQGISDGVSMGGTPGGRHLGSLPGSVPSQGEMRSPCQISG
jgi:hypothetical protein